MVKKYKNNEIKKLSKILLSDGVISVPTDTVYGLCASMNSFIAYNKLYSFKDRASSKNIPLMCSSVNQIQNVAVVNSSTYKIINSLMPGPLTLILKKNYDLPSYVTNGIDTVAVRMASSDVLKALIDLVGCPLFMTSANKSGEKPCSNLEEIEKCFPLLDGMLEGDTLFGEPSTILDCTTDSLKIIREGPISLDEINKVLNEYE